MAGEQVLVVEDNEMSMKLFHDALGASGYRTLEATTGGQALELAFEHAPDLVLMDIQLPDIDGSVSRAAGRAGCPQALYADRGFDQRSPGKRLKSASAE